jgi:hypothetical protein
LPAPCGDARPGPSLPAAACQWSRYVSHVVYFRRKERLLQVPPGGHSRMEDANNLDTVAIPLEVDRVAALVVSPVALADVVGRLAEPVVLRELPEGDVQLGQVIDELPFAPTLEGVDADGFEVVEGGLAHRDAWLR